MLSMACLAAHVAFRTPSTNHRRFHSEAEVNHYDFNSAPSS